MSKAEERKQQAAEVRAAAEQAARKERNIRILGTAAVVLIVAGIIGVGVFGARSGDIDPTGGTVPAAADQSDYSWTLNPDTTATGVMDIYEDFQCPGCGAFEATFADTVKELADSNAVKVVYHPAVFLDNYYTGQHSTRATAAWGCTLKYGVEPAWNYHRLVFSTQPAKEGDGWTDAQLLELGKAAGITGADNAEFQQCVTNGDHMIWGSKAQEAFNAAGIESTPTIKVNGVLVPTDVLQKGPDTFKTWVLETAAG